MPLLKLEQATLNYGHQVLLDRVEFSLRKGERIGLLGRNGAGKSTLLNVVAGALPLDGGERWVREGTVISALWQDLPQADGQDVYDVVAHGLAGIGSLLADYHHAIEDADMRRLEQIQQQIEAQDGWLLQQRVEAMISRLQLPSGQRMETLSGGWRRRVALAQALVSEPEILLLDEPTNHLDIPAIEWLEQQLLGFQGTVLFVTHDRAFLERVATSIVELDRGKLYRHDGGYEDFLRLRQRQLEIEEKERALFDKRLAEEERWIRQGIQARRTRNEGRVRALKAMRSERAGRRERLARADFSLDAAERSGKRVAELESVSKSFGDRCVIDTFSTLVRRGDRIGIVGANGAGKSTLIRILLGQLEPDSGSVRQGVNLEVAYYDQLREQLEPDGDLLDNVCGGQEFVLVGGRKRHAISYLGSFLFSPDRVRMPLGSLSGGEQNRAILARLFSKPANVLVLDEPTNDLDVETLELLEEILLEFDGTVLLVSHDRQFMDNVVTSIMVLEGDGRISEHVGGYSDWAAKGGSLAALEEPASKSARAKNPAPRARQKTAPARLSYKHLRELEALPAKIEALELRRSQLEQQAAAPEFYRQAPEVVRESLAELATVVESLEAAYARWEVLESGGAV